MTFIKPFFFCINIQVLLIIFNPVPIFCSFEFHEGNEKSNAIHSYQTNLEEVKVEIILSSSNKSPQKRSRSPDTREKNKKKSKLNNHLICDNKENFDNGAIIINSFEKTLNSTEEILEEEKKEEFEVNSKNNANRSPQVMFFSNKLDQLKKKIALKPVENVLPKVVSDEMSGGSRRWIQSFQKLYSNTDAKDLKIHDWHRQKSKKVIKVKEESKKPIRLTISSNPPVASTTNVAKAHLTLVVNGNHVSCKIKTFFLSSWPSNDVYKNKEILEFSKKYMLSFLTTRYENGKKIPLKDRSYNWFKEDLKNLFTEHKDNYISQNRLTTHLQKSDSSDLAFLYFHSEQALRFAVKKKIEEFRKTHLQKIDYAILDVCSYFDMCWCCGDSLFLSFYNAHLSDPQKNPMVFIRASGCYRYDKLRDQRHHFPCYESSQAHPLPGQDGFQYEPYIAHAIVEDF